MDRFEIALKYVNFFLAIVSWYFCILTGSEYLAKLVSWKVVDNTSGAAFGLCFCYLIWYYGLI